MTFFLLQPGLPGLVVACCVSVSVPYAVVDTTLLWSGTWRPVGLRSSLLLITFRSQKHTEVDVRQTMTGYTGIQLVCP